MLLRRHKEQVKPLVEKPVVKPEESKVETPKKTTRKK